MSVREKGKQERRTRIIEAARDIIATQGLDALSTRKIAKAADLNIHTLYALVGNKLAIIEAVMRNNHDVIGQFIAQASPEDPIATLFAFVESTYNLLHGDKRQKSLLLAFMSLRDTQSGSAEMDEMLDEGTMRFVRAIDAAVKEDILSSEISTTALGRALNATFTAHLRIYLIGQSDLNTFYQMTRFGFWLQLSAAATPLWQQEFLNNANAESAKLGL